MKRALVIGNSDGIGLAVTRALLDQGARSAASPPIDHPHYVHHVQDVADSAYRGLLSALLASRDQAAGDGDAGLDHGAGEAPANSALVSVTAP